MIGEQMGPCTFMLPGRIRCGRPANGPIHLDRRSMYFHPFESSLSASSDTEGIS